MFQMCWKRSHVTISKSSFSRWGHVLVPYLFRCDGSGSRIETLFNARILILALVISVAAFGGKIISGFSSQPSSQIDCRLGHGTQR